MEGQDSVVRHNMPGTMDHPSVRHLAVSPFQERGQSKSAWKPELVAGYDIVNL